jgi:ATP synthase subunit 6
LAGVDVRHPSHTYTKLSMVYSPLEQFEIRPLLPLRRGSVDLSFTNSSLRRVLTVGVRVVFVQLLAANGGGRLVPSRWQTVGESLYGVASARTVPRGSKGAGYFPFLFVLFTYILTANVLGLVPYGFTVTTHLIVTLALATVVWVGKLIIGVRLHGIKLTGRFRPGGAPLARAPRLVPIEIVGFLITVVSLSVRLFANRRAGHVLLKVRGGFAWSRRVAGGVVFLGHFLPLGVLFLLRGLETGVARVQAYVFTLLTSRYINDRLEGGH